MYVYLRLCVLYSFIHPLYIWLREEFGSRAFFPDVVTSKFDLPHDVAQLSVSLIVEGSDPAVPGSRKRAVKFESEGDGDDVQHSTKKKWCAVLPRCSCREGHTEFLRSSNATHEQQQEY